MVTTTATTPTTRTTIPMETTPTTPTTIPMETTPIIPMKPITTSLPPIAITKENPDGSPQILLTEQ